jgi:hypothetical protein
LPSAGKEQVDEETEGEFLDKFTTPVGLTVRQLIYVCFHVGCMIFFFFSFFLTTLSWICGRLLHKPLFYCLAVLAKTWN